MLHIKLKEMTKATILPQDLPPPSHETPRDPWGGFKGQNSTFSEHGHVAYQLNRITNASTSKHKLCIYAHPRPLVCGQGQFCFRK